MTLKENKLGRANRQSTFEDISINHHSPGFSYEFEMKVRALIEDLIEDGSLGELTELARLYFGIGENRCSLKAIRRKLNLSSTKLKKQVETLENLLFNRLKKIG